MATESNAVERLALWLINALAFWLAEILTAVAPTDGEPAVVLAAALGLQLAAALIFGVAWQAIRGLPVARRLGDRGVAFAPGLILLLPKALQALGAEESRAALLWLGGLAVVVSVLAWLGHRREGSAPLAVRLWTYFAISLAVWLPAMRLKDLARVAETHSSQIVIGSLVALVLATAALVAGALCVAGSRVDLSKRTASLLAALVLVGLVSWRLLTPPPFALQLEPAAERLGRGTPLILIVLDTTRADHLSVYGYPRATSPELERFARDAEVFERAISTSSWTLPAHASLFTGLLPLTHGALRLPGLAEEKRDLEERGIHRPSYPLPGDVPTFAEHLQSFDFATAGLVANYAYLDPAFGVGRGFDPYFSVRNAPVEPRILRLVDRRVRPLAWARRHWQVYRSAEQINRLAFRWLEAQENHRFFLFLNYMEPHLPWGPHLPGLRYQQFAAEASLPDRPGGTPAPGESWRRRVDLYDSNIASLDQQLGELFDRLRAMQLYDRSLIVVTADHGESFGENGADGHGKSLNEAEVWVPLLIKHPGNEPTGRRSERVQLVDLVPTLAAEIGRPFPGRIEGRPLGEQSEGEAAGVPLGGAAGWRLAEMYGDPTDRTGAYAGYQVAFYDGGRKLLVREDGEMLFFDTASGLERPVPLPEDLNEWAAAKRDELFERRRLLEQRARSRQSQLELDPEVKKGLEALGYL